RLEADPAARTCETSPVPPVRSFARSELRRDGDLVAGEDQLPLHSGQRLLRVARSGAVRIYLLPTSSRKRTTAIRRTSSRSKAKEWGIGNAYARRSVISPDADSIRRLT